MNIKGTLKTGFSLLIVIVAMGVFFRVTNLEKKVYWVDEVATSIRVSGYTKQEVTQNLSQLDILSINDLQSYQKLSPQKKHKRYF